MSTRQGAARLNISVPATLKAEMDRVSESVCWSRIAAEAFRVKLLDLASQRRGDAMDDVVARLKAAGELETKQLTADGKAAGAAWAKAKATPGQLRRLDKEYDDTESFAGEPNHLGWGGVVFALLNPSTPDREELREFWEWSLGETRPR